MYVRWQRRMALKRHKIRYDFALVENIGVEGKPTQRHIAYLGSVDAGSIKRRDGLPDRFDFWNGVAERLDALGGRISAEDRQRFEAAIAEKVPRPSKQESNQLPPLGFGVPR